MIQLNVIRLSWSSYQDDENLRLEKEAIEAMGFNYLRPEPTGPRPDKLSTYDVVIVNSQFTVDDSFLEQFASDSRDQLVLTASSGYDHIELDSCNEHEVRVARTPRARAKNVAEHTKACLFTLLRNLPECTGELRNGNWNRASARGRIDNANNFTLGLIGFGWIGREVADLLSDEFDGSILVYDPLKSDRIEEHNHVTEVSFERLLNKSDVLSLHADLNESSRHIIGKEELSKLGNSYLINTARAGLVDYDALYRELVDGSLKGVALDVFPDEPFEESDRWSSIPNVVLTPHTAGFGPSLLDNLREEILETLTQFADDGPLPAEVTPRSEDEVDRLLAGSGA